MIQNNALCINGKALSFAEVFDLAANPYINKAIDELPLLYGLFSFLCNLGLENKAEFVTSEKEISKFLNLSRGAKGFQLSTKLKRFAQLFGVIDDVAVFPALEVKEQKGVLIIQSAYMHQLLEQMIEEKNKAYGERGRYYTNIIHADIVSEKNKVAVLVIIELVSLLARIGRKTLRVSFETLVTRVPQLREMVESESTISVKNQYLKRVFRKVYSLLAEKTEIYCTYKEINIDPVKPKVASLCDVLEISHKGYLK